MYTQQEAEGKRLKNPCDTITEGIGINRQTRNFSKARIDGAFQGTDREAVEMASSQEALSSPHHDVLFVHQQSPAWPSSGNCSTVPVAQSFWLYTWNFVSRVPPAKVNVCKHHHKAKGFSAFTTAEGHHGAASWWNVGSCTVHVMALPCCHAFEGTEYTAVTQSKTPACLLHFRRPICYEMMACLWGALLP